MAVYAREKGEYLRQALTSVFEQTSPPDEVVLVEDGPLTNDLDIVIEEFQRKYDMLTVIRLPKNMGSGIARNEGLKQCKNELVAIMDSDDICKNTRFEKQLAIFVEQPNLAIVGSWIDEFSSNPLKIEGTRSLPMRHENIKRYSYSKCPLNHPSVMFRKSIIKDVGGYQHFYLFEDYYLWARVIMSGAQLYNIQESLVLMRTGEGMTARRGGWKYAVSEVKFFVTLHKMRFIGVVSMVTNIIIRFPIRILPNKFRHFVYVTFLRQN